MYLSILKIYHYFTKSSKRLQYKSLKFPKKNVLNNTVYPEMYQLMKMSQRIRLR